MRIEPPASVPSANGTSPSATAAALPPEEPPAFLRMSKGLRVGPNRKLSQVPRSPIVGLLVLPMMMAPAFSTRSANGQYHWATQSFIARIPPKVNGHPGLKSNRSLIAVGTPCNGPSAAPPASAFSASFAALRASSNPLKTKALRLGLRLSMRVISASTASTGEKSRRRMRIAVSVALI